MRNRARILAGLAGAASGSAAANWEFHWPLWAMIITGMLAAAAYEKVVSDWYDARDADKGIRLQLDTDAAGMLFRCKVSGCKKTFRDKDASVAMTEWMGHAAAEHRKAWNS